MAKKMSRERFRRMVILGIAQFRDPFYQGFAAQLAFYFLLSIVPMIIVFSQLLGVFDISLEFLNEWVERRLGSEFAGIGIIDSLLSYSSTGTMNFFFILMAVWAASRAQFSMARIANYTMSGGRTTGGYFAERFRAIKTIVLTLFTLAFALIILVYGEILLDFFTGLITQTTGVRIQISRIWLLLRWPVAMVLYFMMVSYNYYMLPKERVPFKSLIPGSIFGSVAMLLVTLWFMYVQNNMLNYDILYGSMASVVALLFWFYFLAWALELGVLFNKVWADTSAE